MKNICSTSTLRIFRKTTTNNNKNDINVILIYPLKKKKEEALKRKPFNKSKIDNLDSSKFSFWERLWEEDKKTNCRLRENICRLVPDKCLICGLYKELSVLNGKKKKIQLEMAKNHGHLTK